ncbi:MAG: CRTAC1 family protein, partial [Haloglomus sp.]
FDSTGDGTLDIFVPNAEGSANHLYRNKLADEGELVFEEVAEKAGVAAPDKPGYGAAAADLDNDGNRELVVMSAPDQHHQFYDNNGDGTFTDVSEEVGIVGNGGHICSFGDIDNDGLVDLFIGTSRPDEHVGSPPVPFEGYARNRLFRNKGGLEFEEISEESGVQDLDLIPDDAGGNRTFGVAVVDIDQDGEMEIMQGDDQMIPTEEADIPGEGGVNWGMVHVLDNDGDGTFTDKTKEYHLHESSVMENMGFAYGDFNYDGNMDFLTTAFGDYIQPALPPYDSIERGDHTTQWFTQQADGTFHSYGVGRLVALPFGWGASAFDYDNDGYTDLVYHGGGDFFSTHIAIGTNPGVILNGLGHGMFGFDEAAATSSERDHCRRMTYAVATGDLNQNGYPDIVTGSNQDVAEDSELQMIDQQYDGPLDPYAKYNSVFELNEDGKTAEYTGFGFTEGSLSVEINDGGTDNNWVAVRPAGGMGVVDESTVNRDGIGATIICAPEGMDRKQRFSVTAGASFGSCHSLEKTFGLGDSGSATVEVLWPGGHRNRLYDVATEERIVFPEIPYDYASDLDKSAYESGVEAALQQYADAGEIPAEHVDRFRKSAVRAYEEA